MNPGETYPALKILSVGADRCIVTWTCCDRTARTRLETIERHIRTGRQVCLECERRRTEKSASQAKRDTLRREILDQPGAVLKGIMRAGPHDWWPMRGPMGR